MTTLDTVAVIGLLIGLCTYAGLVAFFVYGWFQRITGRAALLASATTAAWFASYLTLGRLPTTDILEISAYVFWIILLTRILGVTVNRVFDPTVSEPDRNRGGDAPRVHRGDRGIRFSEPSRRLIARTVEARFLPHRNRVVGASRAQHASRPRVEREISDHRSRRRVHVRLRPLRRCPFVSVRQPHADRASRLRLRTRRTADRDRFSAQSHASHEREPVAPIRVSDRDTSARGRLSAGHGHSGLLRTLLRR